MLFFWILCGIIFVYELYMKQLAAMTDDVFHRQAVFPGHHGKGEGAAPLFCVQLSLPDS